MMMPHFRLFSYGTLQSTSCNHRLFKEWIIKVENAHIHGYKLYNHNIIPYKNNIWDTVSIPIAVYTNDFKDCVDGQIITFKNKVIKIMDRFEKFYERHWEKEIKAWIYIMPQNEVEKLLNGNLYRTGRKINK